LAAFHLELLQAILTERHDATNTARRMKSAGRSPLSIVEVVKLAAYY
jgi:hypothetical protein